MSPKPFIGPLIFVLIFSTGCARIVKETSGEAPVGTQDNNLTYGRVIDDGLIDTYVTANIMKAHEDFENANYNVISHNGIVLLVGQVQTEELRTLAEQAAKQVANVRRIHNELVVAGASSLPARGSDTWIKSKIKSRMLTTSGVNPLRVKVIVSNGVVYLMGRVSQFEAKRAVEVVHRTYGVQKIVKVFEYLD